MKLLLHHVMHFEYKVTEPTKFAASIKEEEKEGSVENALLVYVCVEEKDSKDTLVEAAESIKDVAKRVGTNSCILFPFSHLSSHIASPKKAQEIMEKMAEALEGMEVLRVPFGWYKRFSVQHFGHPLSTLSRTL